MGKCKADYVHTCTFSSLIIPVTTNWTPMPNGSASMSFSRAHPGAKIIVMWSPDVFWCRNGKLHKQIHHYFSKRACQFYRSHKLLQQRTAAQVSKVTCTMDETLTVAQSIKEDHEQDCVSPHTSTEPANHSDSTRPCPPTPAPGKTSRH